MELMLRRRELIAMQSGLPSAYRKVEYLQSSRDYETYINTGVQIASDVEMEMVISVPNIIPGGRYLLGRYEDNKGDFYLYVASNGYFQTAYGCTYNNTTQMADTSMHTFRFSISETLTYVYCDDTQVLQKTVKQSYPEMPIYVAGTSMHYAKLSCNTYSVRILKSGAIIRNFIPCVRKSDSKPGMYDTVSKTFYTNAGTGEFIVPA